MVVPLAGYSTRRLLRASARTKVYEAVRKRDERRVLAKVFELADPSAEARVEHEFRLLEQLDAKGVVRALGIERAGHQLVLLLDFVDGRNLEQYAGGKPIAVEQFLPIALSLASTLASVHAQRIVHRDIKPSNVLIETGTDAVYLADFGISVLLESERAHLYDPEVLEGTLPYVSPEQTGRTAREVDVRSDLYSLGATFYELLTGRRPFEAGEPLQLIHAHLARRPAPAHEVVPSIPTLLSAMVGKLLEKAPEDRYQSARGLHADLVRLAEALRSNDASEFPLGERDYADELRLPHRLYGRDAEQRTLEQELARVGGERRRAVVFVEGAAGIGKTALLRTLDLHEGPHEGPHEGYVAAGRFEQIEQPYHGIVRAFESVIAQLLTLGDEQLRRWRSRLSEALGPLAGVVTAMVPGLELILGDVPSIPALQLAESRNRLHVALGRFLAALAREGPLALVLDDMQWADRSSLELVRALACEGPESAILLVTAWRTDTPEAERALTELSDALTKVGRPLTRVLLQPLAAEQLERLLADVLRRDRSELSSLVESVARKTGGNPLYVRSFLLDLAARGLVRPGSNGWEWDAEAIAEAPVPDSATALMRARLERLPPVPAKLLEIAACIGSRFDLGLLEAIAQLPAGEFAAALHALERDGLIGPGKAAHVFCHDRIRDSALELLSSERRRELHWTIARRSLAAVGEAIEGERLFELLEHVDAGMPDIATLDRELRRELGRLHVRAGEQALASAAWTSARRYFEVATALLDVDDTKRTDTSFAAAFGYAQALELTDATDDADTWFQSLLTWDLSLVQRSLVIDRRVRILQLKDRMRDAYEYGRAGLRRLGIDMPAKVSLLRTLVMVVRALLAARKWPLERMLSAPLATDERDVAALYLRQAVKGPAYIVQPELGGYAAAAHAVALMQAGHHPTAAECHATMAFVQASLGNFAAAWRRCNDSAELGERREATPPSLLSPHLTRMAIGPLGRPHREFIDLVEPLHARALELGERTVAGYIAAMGVLLHVEAGVHLREALEIDARVRAYDESYGVHEMAIIAEFDRRSIQRLAGRESAEFMTVEELGDTVLTDATKVSMRATEIWARIMLGQPEGLWERAQLLRGYPRALIASFMKARVAAIAAIVESDHGFEHGGAVRRQALRSMRHHLRVAAGSAKKCPENYQPYRDIIRAEIAALRGRDSALRWFELARAAAFDSGIYHAAGLASLRLSTWAKRCGLPVLEAQALHFARNAFERWGAWAIVERLDRIELTVELDAHTGPSTTTATSVRSSASSGDSSRDLDVATLLGTLQGISEDLRLEEVITRVLQSAIENAGADKGALLLARDDEYALVAEGRDGVMHEFMRDGVRLRDAAARVPCSVVNYALRTGPVVIEDAAADPRFAGDPYIREEGVRALLCMPIHKQSVQVGVLLLENRLAAGAFTASRLEILRALMGQAASALDNARLYAALSRSEAQWRSLVDGAPDMITQVDADGRIELVNHGWPGQDPRDSIGQPGDLHMDPSSRVAWRAALAAVIETGLPRELELGHDLGDRKRWTMTRLAAIHQPGSREKVLSISTDITERKSLEAQVRQQQKLESIGTFASGVAHEINNPIQGILNYAELINMQPDDVEVVREYSAEIQRESDRVATIVRDLLAFSRRDTAQHVERVDLGALISATLSLVGALLRRNEVRVDIDVPADLPRVEGRPQQIRQILMNLITNARDATVARGADRSSGDRVITIRARSISNDGVAWVRLSVEDRGTGMSEEVRAQAFDPFFTTKGRDQGTGLGLAVSHGIAREHGGKLWFETELGRGTTFHLDLPAALGAPTAAPTPQDAGPQITL